MDASAPQPALNTRLRRFLVWAILLLTAGYTFLDYWEYSRVETNDPHAWPSLATGCGLAPAQYRVGVYFTANFFVRLTRLRFHQVFAAADFFCAGLALACIFFLLTRMEAFRRSPKTAQWAQVMLALLLTQIYLGWTLWFQQPETMPTLAVVAVTALLCWAMTLEKAPVPRPLLAFTLLLVALLGATIRADAVTALAAGMAVACVATRGVPGRAWVLGAAAISLFVALGVEYSLADIVFPHAVRSAPAFQLLDNLRSVNGYFAVCCTLPAWALTVWLASRQWSALPLWLRGVLIGSVFHFLMFLTFGMTEEVRIFLPFTLTLIPLSATLLFHWFTGTGSPGDEAGVVDTL